MMIGEALDPRRSDLKAVADALKTYGMLIPEALPSRKRAFIALAMERQAKHMAALEAAGTFGLSFHGHDLLVNDPSLREAAAVYLDGKGKAEEAKRLRMGETTASSAVAAFTVQQLAVVEQVYERTLLDRFCDVRVQNQPRAFVHTWKQKAAQNGGAFSTGDLFNSKLDPDYTAIASEGDTSRAADFQMASSTVTAVENAIHAEWHLNAQQDLASQYGMSLPERGREFLALELGREVEGQALEDTVASAGVTGVWPKTAPAGTIYEVLDPDKWRNTIFRTITGLDNDCYKSADGFRGTEVMLGDPDSMQLMEDLNAMGFMQQGINRRATAGDGMVGATAANGATEGAGALSIGRWDGYKVRYMASNTIALLPKPGGPDQDIAQIHSVYVPITDLGLFLDLTTRKVKIAAHTRTANVTLRPGLICALEIGD
jgi:hypothetical protein